MKRYFLLLTLVLTLPVLSAQPEVLRMENDGKTIELKKNNDIDFSIDITGDTLSYGNIVFTGSFLKYQDGRIYLQTSKKTESWESIDGESFSSRYRYKKDAAPVSIPVETIEAIYYQGTGRKIASIGSLTITSAGIAAIVLAPLVSMEGRSRSFNTKRYYNITGVGIMAIGISLPITLIISPKEFILKDRWQTGIPVWRIAN